MRVLAGRYELGAPLGTGGMARVVEAVDTRLGRPVAVKLLAAEAADRSTRARFVREARAAAAFVHPNAVTVYDAGEDDGTLFIVMERVEGPNLADVLGRQGRPHPDVACRIIDQVLSALEAAHARDLVHRDVKPSNILLAGDGTAKLADFGIAKRLSEITTALTTTGQVIGTPRYLAPEQAAGESATPASDLYSTGVVLYEMLVGEPPFAGDSPFATMLAHQQQPVPRVREQCPEVDATLAAVVERALAKAPGDRYPSARAMRDALALRSGADETPPPTAPYPVPGTPPSPRVAPAPSRRRRLLPAVLAVAAAVAVGLLAYLMGAGTSPDDAPSGPEAAGATTTTAAPPTTAAPTTTDPGPRTIGELTDFLVASDPENIGEKGRDLLDKLQRVQRATGEERAERAEDLSEDIAAWVEDGKLDAQIGALALRLLEAEL